MPSISSEVWITFEFISYARCAEIRLEISSTAFTLEVSKNPCKIDPKPVDAGLPAVAVPEAGVSRYRLSPPLLLSRRRSKMLRVGVAPRWRVQFVLLSLT